ncbi:TPA: hypothetical protein JG871_003931 [Enterobacter hormaechei subsp. xiangfangensis]|nr:hypothetical protein [Enterobacter hormaechei subsp. xiangfangensis]
MKNNITGINPPEYPCADARPNLFPGLSKKEIELVERAQLITQQFDLLIYQVKELGDPDCVKALEAIGHQRSNAVNLARYLATALRK